MCVTAYIAVATAAGESDIEIMIALRIRRILVFIEDKIDVLFTPRQAERYRERAVRAQRERSCDEAVTVLVAPAAYLAGAVGTFDRSVSYEEFHGHFAERHKQGDFEVRARASHAMEMLEQAILRQRRGYVAVPDTSVSGIWSHYVAVARERFASRTSAVRIC